MITHIVLNEYPQVPEQFYQHYLDLSQQQAIELQALNDRAGNPLIVNGTWLDPKGWWDRTIERDGKQIPTRHQVRLALNDDFEQWLRETFAPDWELDHWVKDQGYTVSVGDSDTHVPHADSRRWHLFYVITDGGPQCTTDFWMEKGQPPELEAYHACKSYDDLVRVESTRLPVRQWTLFNSRFIHSLERCTASRNTIQVSLKRLPPALEEKVCSGNA